MELILMLFLYNRKTYPFFRSSLNPEERKVYGDSPFFGINLGVDKCGSINVGDKVCIFFIIFYTTS